MRIDDSGFRWPDGVEIVQHGDDEIRMRVSIPTDEHGFLGRQCRRCFQLFRIDADAYEVLTDDTELWCVYCGHGEEHRHFITDQQRERAAQPVGDWVEQSFQQILDNTFGRASRSRSSSSRSGIEISYRSTPFFPRPLPGINEEELVRIRTCTRCATRYAVFSEHRFCPLCGPLSAEVVAADGLEAETARLDAMRQIPAAEAAQLREQGVFTRSWVDTLENLVGIVEKLARAVFFATVADAAVRVQGKGSVFQRLDDFADLFVAAGHPDLRIVLDGRIWARLQETWATRHLFTHNDGVVDEKYLSRVPGSATKLGQRATVTELQCRRAIEDVRTLSTTLAGFIPAKTL